MVSEGIVWALVALCAVGIGAVVTALFLASRLIGELGNAVTDRARLAEARLDVERERVQDLANQVQGAPVPTVSPRSEWDPVG